MIKTEEIPFFVDVNWLAINLAKPNIRVLDATWAVPGDSPNVPPGVIPGAKFFDLAYLKSKTPLGAPYPPTEVMKNMVGSLGLTADHHVIIYDKQGCFSAPRVWWAFRAIGHKNVSVLRDGYPAWIGAGQDVASEFLVPTMQTNYKTSDPLVKGVSIDAVLKAISTDIQIIDARPADRFHGKMPEPREGVRTGHIPGSINLPLSILKNSNNEILEDNEVRQIIKDQDIDLARPIITTCGSGVTAAALALILYDLGAEDVAVYTGSWAEYGASNHPIETI